MSSIIRATTTSGLQVAPDNSGSLQLQTNGTTAAVTIDTSQNVGIGTTTPSGKFHVANGDIYITNGYSLKYSATSYITPEDNSIGARISAGTITMWSGSTPTERMRITDGGEVYIAGTTDRGAFNLQCNGTGVWGAGAYTNGSDARIKDDIQPITSSLEVVNKLNPVTFKYKEDWSKDQSVQTGFIAQELQETLKDEIYIDGLVSTGGEYLSVAYQNIIPLLTKAIQEQQTIINDLKARIETLEAR